MLTSFTEKFEPPLILGNLHMDADKIPSISQNKYSIYGPLSSENKFYIPTSLWIYNFTDWFLNLYSKQRPLFLGNYLAYNKPSVEAGFLIYEQEDVVSTPLIILMFSNRLQKLTHVKCKWQCKAVFTRVLIRIQSDEHIWVWELSEHRACRRQLQATASRAGKWSQGETAVPQVAT